MIHTPISPVDLCPTRTSLTFEVWSATRQEELDGLNLREVTVLMLLLCVAVGPVVQTEPQCYVCLNFPDEH